MKIRISQILILIIIINMLLPLSTFAVESNMQIYNHDTLVMLSNPLEKVDDNYYIHNVDITKLGISIDYFNDGFNLYKRGQYENSTLSVYKASSTIFINGESSSYNNPIIEIDNELYISIELIAKVFSFFCNIDKSSGIISLWIRNDLQTIYGNISLPNGIFAPVGGLEVTVCLTNIGGGSGHGGGSTGGGLIVGYAGISLPQIPNYSYDKEISGVFQTKKVVIPEGKNNIDYFIENKNSQYAGSVGYTVNTNSIFGQRTYSCSPYRTQKVDMAIATTAKKAIRGSINLPNGDEATSDIDVAIIAKSITTIKVTYNTVPMENMKPIANLYTIKNKEIATLVLDGVEITTDTQPIIIDGVVLAPFRALATSIGVYPTFDEETQTILFVKDTNYIAMQLGNMNAYTNGKSIQLSVAPQIIDGSIFIPAKFFALEFGYDVAWDSVNRIMKITTK